MTPKTFKDKWNMALKYVQIHHMTEKNLWNQDCPEPQVQEPGKSGAWPCTLFQTQSESPLVHWLFHGNHPPITRWETMGNPDRSWETTSLGTVID